MKKFLMIFKSNIKKNAFTLAEGAAHTAMPNKKQSSGFTLAEVLITLGIIGVVAALTLPTLIANHKKQVLVNQLKKVVNTLENGIRMAVAQDEVSSFKETKAYSRFSDFYDCYSDCSGIVEDIVKYFNLKYVSIDTSDKDYDSDYKNIDGSNVSWSFKYPVVTPDGSIIYLYHDGIRVDVNGNKGPNKIGRDTFIFDISGYDAAPAGVLRDRDFHTRCVNESQYLENGCYYAKIVADGWKMTY